MATRRPSGVVAALGRLPISPSPKSYSRCLLAFHAEVFYSVPVILRVQRRSVSSSSTKPALTRPAPPNDRVNPPTSTLPALLDVPARTPDQSLFSYLYRTGKAYLGFYKTGIKNVWGNYKLSQSLKARIQNDLQRVDKERLSTASSQLQKGPSVIPNNIQTALALRLLSRGNFQLLKRNRYDMARVPLFAMLFVIFGEWLPLFIIFLTPMVPYPCRIPAQIRKEREKLERRRKDSFRGVTTGRVPAQPSNTALDKASVSDQVDSMERGQLLHISRSLGLHGKFWDYFASINYLPPASTLKYRIRSRLQYLEVDDALIVRDGGVKDMLGEEVRIACEERGIDVLGVGEAELRRRLEAWLEGRKNGQVLKMLLNRPSAWSGEQGKR